jgi:superfamily II DNA or RNA helicase
MKKINNHNSLIIFKTIKYGKLLHELLQKKYPERKFYYLDGSTKPAEREEIRRKVIEEDTNACILASAPLFAVGVNIPSLKYLINAQPYKSKIKVIQSIGRTLRKHENKDGAVIIDVVDDLCSGKKENHTYKHAKHRLKIYQKEQFAYAIKEIELKDKNNDNTGRLSNPDLPWN